jgi:hypothetical protein
MRKELQEFIRASEALLAHTLRDPLKDEECEMIEFYVVSLVAQSQRVSSLADGAAHQAMTTTTFPWANLTEANIPYSKHATVGPTGFLYAHLHRPLVD